MREPACGKRGAGREWAGPALLRQAGRVFEAVGRRVAARPVVVACDTLTDGCERCFSRRVVLLPQPTAVHYSEQGDELIPALWVGTRKDTGNLLHPHLAFTQRARRKIAALLLQLRKGV